MTFHHLQTTTSVQVHTACVLCIIYKMNYIPVCYVASRQLLQSAALCGLRGISHPPYPFTSPPSTLSFSIFYFCLFPFLLASSIFVAFPTPRGPGYPLFAFAPPLSISFLIFCSSLLFSFFLFLFALPIYCPSFPFLPESSHSVSRPEVVGGDRTWV